MPELISIMRGFSTGLGVRCQHCHVSRGADTDDLTAFDFASDEKEAKGKARVMLRMTRAINQEYLPQVKGELGLRVTCATCHHGREHPETIEDVMKRELAAGGLAAAKDAYRKLRGEHHGGWAYDFGEGPLAGLAQGFLRAGKTAEALGLLELNLEFHPGAEWTGALYGEALLAAGRRADARKQFEKVIAVHPKNRLAARRLAELSGDPDGQ